LYPGKSTQVHFGEAFYTYTSFERKSVIHRQRVKEGCDQVPLVPLRESNL